MNDDTMRLMREMARRAKPRPQMCGHAIARWEAIHSRRAESALGIGDEDAARLRVTPLTADAIRIAEIACDIGCDPEALHKILSGGTAWPN